MKGNFYSKKELVERCRSILYGNECDCELPDDDQDFLLNNVFVNHPRWCEKKGCGIGHIEVRLNIYRERCFHLVRTDGSVTDISFRQCVNVPSKRALVCKACRNAVRDRIRVIRESVILPFKCPVTGDVVTDRKNLHVDHYDMTFEELFSAWIADKDFEFLYDMVISTRKDNDVIASFADESISDDFAKYHDEHTHLRVVSKKANLSVLKKTDCSVVPEKNNNSEIKDDMDILFHPELW